VGNREPLCVTTSDSMMLSWHQGQSLLKLNENVNAKHLRAINNVVNPVELRIKFSLYYKEHVVCTSELFPIQFAVTAPASSPTVVPSSPASSPITPLPSTPPDEKKVVTPKQKMKKIANQIPVTVQKAGKLTIGHQGYTKMMRITPNHPQQPMNIPTQHSTAYSTAYPQLRTNPVFNAFSPFTTATSSSSITPELIPNTFAVSENEEYPPQVSIINSSSNPYSKYTMMRTPLEQLAPQGQRVTMNPYLDTLRA